MTDNTTSFDHNFHEQENNTIVLLEGQRGLQDKKDLDPDLERLRQETDSLLRKRERITQDNLKLWATLTSVVTKESSFAYEWARKRLDNNDFEIESIDDRLGQIKKLEQDHKYGGKTKK